MCLIVFAWQVVPGVPLIAAANRDEFYDRDTTPAAAWPDAPQIFAGRDLKAGGSWMGITRPGTAAASEAQPMPRAECGAGEQPAAHPPPYPAGSAPSRFAALTNVRQPRDHNPLAPSRGQLVADFLAGAMTAQEYVAQIAPGAAQYNGFNLVLCDGKELVWYSNKGEEDPRNGKALEPGIYGLSNALLDSAWPKVLKTKAQFASLLCLGAPEDAYFEMLSDTTRAPDMRLPETGVPLELERVLSAVKIESPNYGTRSSTVVKLYADSPAELHEIQIR
ncbi:NRDE family protein [Pseudoduganella violaceinigra]|uniref:NRDE family protein n=1 Tax=Pseudoduganella violaceinigra TaxID=246602 RepID=UPI0003F87045|nr:NRDE family protein [Pseudoduganella violaceinigra]